MGHNPRRTYRFCATCNARERLHIGGRCHVCSIRERAKVSVCDVCQERPRFLTIGAVDHCLRCIPSPWARARVSA